MDALRSVVTVKPSTESELGASERLRLTLEVSDREVLEELLKRPEGLERERFALTALRLGILALKTASGQLDAASIREAGRGLLQDMQHVLADRASQLTRELAASLTHYFDPTTGALPSRIQALIQKDGELERVLRSHLGPEDSVLARSIATHLGEGSPVFKMLSPTEQGGIRAQLERTLEAALEQQRQVVLKEFSLDTKDSALSRLVTELGQHSETLGNNLKVQVETAVNEFSLDRPDSALSRLVLKVDAAQQSIVQQFSSDNAESALNKLSRLLQNTSEQIGQNLTLDNEHSALSRLRRELQRPIDELVRRNDEFQAKVHETLATFQARKAEADRGTRHGQDFEARLVSFLTELTQRQNDVGEPTGHTPGNIKHSKKGDFVVTLGPESPAPGARMVWEAKEDQSYTVAKALQEMDEARKNRAAQLGVFVFSKKTAPAELSSFVRYGDDLLVLWDADDPHSDVSLRAAYSCARALSIRQARQSAQSTQALQELELATRAVEKQAGYLEDLRKFAESSKSSAEKIVDRVDKMRRELETQISRLDESLESLRQGPSNLAGG